MEKYAYIPYTKTNKDSVRESIEKNGFKICGIHIDIDKNEYFIIEVPPIADLVARLIVLERETKLE